MLIKTAKHRVKIFFGKHGKLLSEHTQTVAIPYAIYRFNEHRKIEDLKENQHWCQDVRIDDRNNYIYYQSKTLTKCYLNVKLRNSEKYQINYSKSTPFVKPEILMPFLEFIGIDIPEKFTFVGITFVEDKK